MRFKPDDFSKFSYDLQVLKRQRDALIEMNEFQREEIKALKRALTSLEELLKKPHGSARYASGCRCDICADANARYHVKYRAKANKKKINC